jgi:PqqD family protein of HPr-rel-A system
MSGRLGRLAINDDGFLFDPMTGESFTVNGAGALIIKSLKEGKSAPQTAEALMASFEASHQEAERDVNDFLGHLRALKLI